MFCAVGAQLHESLEGYQPQVPLREQHLGLWASVLKSLGGEGEGEGRGGSDGEEHAAHGPRGVYMYGGVGTGKTFMMDLFFQVRLAAPGAGTCNTGNSCSGGGSGSTCLLVLAALLGL